MMPVTRKLIGSERLSMVARAALPICQAIVEGYDYNPGDSDLDNEQPITVSMTLGDYRKASSLKYHLEEMV